MRNRNPEATETHHHDIEIIERINGLDDPEKMAQLLNLINEIDTSNHGLKKLIIAIETLDRKRAEIS